MTIAIAMSACVPKAVATKADCGSNQGFNSVTRSCYSLLVANKAPVVTNFVVATALTEDTPKTINLPYTDADYDLATQCQLSAVSHLTVTSCTCAAGTCSAIVTGVNGYYGAAQFSYSVKANNMISNLATVTLVINPVNDAPDMTAIAWTTTSTTWSTISNSVVPLVSSGSGWAITAQENSNTYSSSTNADITVNSDNTLSGYESSQSLTLTAVSSNQALLKDSNIHVTSVNATLKRITFTTEKEQSGTANITLTLTDNGGTANGGVDTLTKVIPVTVNAVNDPPSVALVSTFPTTNENNSVTVDFTINDIDSAITCANLSGIAIDQLLVAGISITEPVVSALPKTCRATIVPGANLNGNTYITFTVSDGSPRTTSTVPLLFTVNPVNQIPILSISGSTPSPATIAENSMTTPNSGYYDMVVAADAFGLESSQVLSLTAVSSDATLIPNVSCQNYTPGAGGPSGVVTPTSSGQYYFDTTNKKCYVSTGTTSSAWKLYPSLTVFPKFNYAAAYTYGTSAPTGTPSAAGLYYLNTALNKLYRSTGTSTFTWAADTTLTDFYVAYVPLENQSGNINIAMTLTDDGGTLNGGVNTVTHGTGFNVTISYVNNPPSFYSTITRADTNEGGVVVAGPFVIDEDLGNSAIEDLQTISITSIVSDNPSVLPSGSITAFYDLNDNGVEDTGESRAIGVPFESIAALDSKLHGLYLKLSPIAGVSGNANITLTVNDGNSTAATTFSLIVHPVAALHGGWSNISSVGIKTDKNGAPVSIKTSSNGDLLSTSNVKCNYNTSVDTYKCDSTSNNCTTTLAQDGTVLVAEPHGVITPSAANVLYWDSSNKKCYRSQSASKFSWVDMTTSCPVTRISVSPTLLSVAVAISDTSINVASTAGFPAAGNITIDSEIISYTSKTNTTFNGLSAAAIHSLGATVSYTANGTNFIIDSGSQLPPVSTAKDQYYYDTATKSCYSSKETNPGIWGWNSTTYVPSTITLSWNAFTVTGSGADSSVGISGWNVYRREAGHDYDFVSGFLKLNAGDTMSITGSSTRTFTDTTAVSGTVYYYLVRPVDSTARHLTVSTPEVFSEVRIFAPKENYSFVHRWMANQEVCNSMHMTTTTSNKVDPTHNYRCPYKGPGEYPAGSGYYDIGKDMLVDISEVGCPYTAAPACSSNGCIGIGAPTMSSAINSIYYDRNSGICYINDDGGTTWVDHNHASTNPRIMSSVSKVNTALNPPLTNITQATAAIVCGARDITAAQGLIVGGTTSVGAARLPSKKEFIAYSASPLGMSDPNITDLEQGFSLNVQSRCNSTNANGLESAYTDSTIPSTSYIYSIPGTSSSSIRSIYTGSVPWVNNYGTEDCSSRYGIQDVYGNVAEWVQDKMTCYANKTCTANSGTDLGNYNFDTSNAFSYIFGFDKLTGPYNDADADGLVGTAGDLYLTNWDFRDELYGAGKFSFPVGMPINIDIGSVTALSTSGALPFLLNIGPTSGITTSQLHEDGIIVNGAAVYADPSHQGSFAQGGSYLSGNRSGRYSSELVPDSQVGPDLGFRCYIPIDKSNFPSDVNHTYSY